MCVYYVCVGVKDSMLVLILVCMPLIVSLGIGSMNNP